MQTRLPIHQDRWWRILGVAFTMYVLSFIDRTNIAMAIPAMRAELHMSAVAIGQATSVFFWGYIILQIPVGRLAGTWSAKRVIFLQLLAWAAISMTTAFVHTETELWLNRFALGLAEGGVLTCTIVLIRAWFTKAERARANTMFLLSLAIAPMIANPLSGLVLSISDWRTMFLLEAVPGLAWGAVWLWAIADSPAKAAWLPAAERDRLLAELAAEDATIPPRSGHWLSVLYSRPVVLLVLYNFGALAAEWGVGFWLPSVVKETGASIGLVGVLTAFPYAVGATMMVLVARSSDRRQERKWHMIAATSASGLFLFCAQYATGFGPYAAVVFLTLSIGAFLGRFGPFWTLPSEVLPPAVAGAGIGLINGAGNLGGTVGPVVFGYVRDTTGSFNAALTAAGIALIGASLLALAIRSPGAREATPLPLPQGLRDHPR